MDRWMDGQMDGWIDDSRHQTHLVQEAMKLLPALDPAAAGGLSLAWKGYSPLYPLPSTLEVCTGLSHASGHPLLELLSFPFPLA